MAITKRTNPRTGQITGYQVTVRVPGERSKSKTFPTYEEAERFEKKMALSVRSSRAKSATKTALSPRRGIVSLSSESLADLLKAFKEAFPNARFCQHHSTLVPAVEHVRVCDLDDDWCRAWCEKMRLHPNGRGGTLAEGTIGLYIKIIRRVCRWKAEKMGVECPELGVSFKHLEAGWDDGRERRLKGDEEERIRTELGLHGCRPARGKNAVPGQLTKPRKSARQYQLLFDFAIETCARESELVNLPWREIDIERGVWNLSAKRTKKKWKRDIVLTPKAVEVLRELVADRDPASPRVFHRLPGPKAVSQCFTRLKKRLGIEDLTFHDLRHEGATKLRLSGAVLPAVLMRMVGHKSEKMAMRYFNPLPEEIREQMWAVLAPKSPGSMGDSR